MVVWYYEVKGVSRDGYKDDAVEGKADTFDKAFTRAFLNFAPAIVGSRAVELDQGLVMKRPCSISIWSSDAPEEQEKKYKKAGRPKRNKKTGGKKSKNVKNR